jgi:hypothetical protein
MEILKVATNTNPNTLAGAPRYRSNLHPRFFRYYDRWKRANCDQTFRGAAEIKPLPRAEICPSGLRKNRCSLRVKTLPGHPWVVTQAGAPAL